MSKQIGAREISEYAQKYNMPLGKDTPLSMEWCFEMSDKAYQQGRADVIEEFKDLGKLYSEIRADAIDEFANKLLHIVSDNYCYPYFENAIYEICNDAIVDTKKQMQKGEEL